LPKKPKCSFCAFLICHDKTENKAFLILNLKKKSRL
jgi:hypothetical protein